MRYLDPALDGKVQIFLHNDVVPPNRQALYFDHRRLGFQAVTSRNRVVGVSRGRGMRNCTRVR
jgi:hypothetical protein